MTMRESEDHPALSDPNRRWSLRIATAALLISIGLLAIAQSVTENIQTGSSDSASQELVWPAQTGASPTSAPSLMSWPDEHGGHINSGEWRWPNSLVPSPYLVAQASGDKHPFSMAGSPAPPTGGYTSEMRDQLIKQQLFCSLRACGHSGRANHPGQPAIIGPQFDPRTGQMMTPGAEQGGAKKMKGLAKNQHKTSELGLEAPSTKKEDSDKKMQGEWNKVMDGIGSNAGKGMYIPAGTDFMQKKPAPHNPTIMGESPPSTFFPHGIHASHRHAAGIEQGPALPVPDSGKNWFTWAAAGPADAKSAAPSSFSSQSEARIDHDQGRADRGAVRQGSSSVLSTQPTPPSISMNIEDSQLHLGTPSDVRSDKGQVGEEKRRNTKAEVTKDEDKMHPAERMQVTVPTGLKGGQLLRVETPQGLMQVTIPAGLKAGQLFELILPPTGKKEGEAGAAEAPTRASLSRAGDASGIQSAKNVHEPLLRHNKAPAGEEASEAAVAVEGMAARDLAKDLRNKMPRTRFYEDAMRMAAKDLVRDLHAKLANSVSAKGPASQAYKDAMRMVVTDLSGDLHAGTPRANQEHDAMSPIEEHANQEHDANQEHANQEHDAMSPIEEHDAMSPDRLAAHLLAHHHANADKQEAYSPRTGELRDDEQGGASVEGVGETGKNNAKARQRTDKKVQINEEHSGHAGVLGVYTQASSPDRPASSSDDVMQRKDEKMQVDQAREDAAARDLARRRISAAATSEADEGPAAAAAASAPTEAEAEGSGVRARLRSSEPADTKGNPSASVATVYGATEVQPEQGKEENGDASEKGDATAGMPPGTLKLVFMLVGTNKRLMTSAQIDAFKTQASLYASEKSPQGERLLPPLVTTPVLADVAGLDSAVSLTVHVTPLAKETCATPLEQLSKWTIPDESLLPLSPIQDSGPPTLHLIAVEGCPQFTNLKAPRTSKAPQHALSAHSIMMRHMQRQELQLEAKMAAYEAKEHATIEREHHLEHELAHERLAEHSARAAATLNTLKQLPRSPHAHAKQMHQVLHAAAPSSNLTRDASATAPLAKVHTGSASTATAKVPNPSATTSPDLTQNVAQWLGVKAAARTASPARTPHALESAKQLWASAKAAALKRQAKNRKQEHEMVMKKLAEVEKDYARVSSQMAKEHPAEDSTSGELQDAEQDVEAYRHASASAEGSDAKEDAGYVPPGSLRAAATGKGAVQPSLQAASAHVGGKASLATRSMPHVPVTGTRGTTTLSYMHQKQALDAVSEDENMKQLWDLVDGKVAPAAQAPPWKAGDAMETGEQATIRSAEEHTADAAHDDHPATTAAFITGMASAPLATTRIIASEPADSSSTALPPKTALAKPAEPARQEEVAALQQAEIAKALAVEKAELAKIQAQISASAAAKESSLRSAGITASSPFARKQQAALKLQLYSKQLMKVNEKLEQHHDWQSADRLEQALEKQMEASDRGHPQMLSAVPGEV